MTVDAGPFAPGDDSGPVLPMRADGDRDDLESGLRIPEGFQGYGTARAPYTAPQGTLRGI
jgi:hypothetical protein